MLLTEALRPLETKTYRVRTPLGSHHRSSFAKRNPARAHSSRRPGLVGLADQLLPEARLGYLGMVRNEATRSPNVISKTAAALEAV